jgi:hypothetical protein
MAHFPPDELDQLKRELNTCSIDIHLAALLKQLEIYDSLDDPHAAPDRRFNINPTEKGIYNVSYQDLRENFIAPLKARIRILQAIQAGENITPAEYNFVCAISALKADPVIANYPNVIKALDDAAAAVAPPPSKVP